MILLTIFDKRHSPTPAAFHRILESYGLAVKKLQHEKILLAEQVKKRDATTIHTLEAGPELSDHICENCKAPLAEACGDRHMLGIWQGGEPHPKATGPGAVPRSGWSHLEAPH